MEKILAKRYAFCDFSDIAGFPHPVPTIIEWDDYLLRFRGSKNDHPGEHLFNFHKCMLEHGFVHEDVLIKLFKLSLEENAREWCQSLPNLSIHSLKDFHVAFNSYYEKFYSADLIFDNCCEEFNLHNKAEDVKREGSLHHLFNDLYDTVPSHHDEPQMDDKGAEDSPINSIYDFHQSEELVSLDIHHKDHFSSKVYEGLLTSEISIVHQRDDQKCMHAVVNDLHEEYAAEMNTIHYDQEISNPDHDNHIDASVIGSNTPTVLDCYHDHIVSFEKLKDDEQIESLTVESIGATIDVEGSPHLPDLQKKTDCSRHLQEGQQNGSDQKFSSYFPPAEIKRFSFIIEFCEGNEEQLQHSQLEQQFKEVFFHNFEDPIEDFLDSISSMNVKIFMSEEDYLYHLLKPFFCMIWYSLLFGSRFSMMPVNHFLTWLHWKYDVT
jgi:hypothetical protein